MALKVIFPLQIFRFIVHFPSPCLLIDICKGYATNKLMQQLHLCHALIQPLYVYEIGYLWLFATMGYGFFVRMKISYIKYSITNSTNFDNNDKSVRELLIPP